MDSTYSSLYVDLCSLLADAFQVTIDEITPELAFGDLPQWDSMGHMEMLLRLEEVYGIEIDADSIAELVSLPVIFEKLVKRDQPDE